MDEYEIEIAAIRRTLARLRADEAAASIIEEYEAEYRNLKAIYQAARETFGNPDPRLATALDSLGFGPWTLQNVYSFVYEAAMDVDTEGRDLANVVTHTDYAGSLLAVLANGA